MSIRSSVLAAAAILATANAHMIMKQPVPYAVDKLDNSPITKAQYPCKSQNGFSFTTATEIKVGEEMTFSLDGSAVHGGGGCQLSIAQGQNPTADTKFKVIKTIVGCPTDEAKSFSYTLPEGTPNGDLTFAWTWNSRLAGQKELYMNCAPIKVTGGADDTKAFDALPDMLLANIDDTCKTVDNANIEYPNPGSVVETAAGAAATYAPPVGAGCGSSGNGGGSPSGAPAASSGAPVASSAPAGAPVSSAPPVVSSAAPSNPGGVFAPGASSGAGAPQSTLTTLVTVTAAPSSPAQATSAPAAGTGPPAAPSSGSPTTGGATCSQNGAVVCNGPTQFGLCNNGNVVWQDVAAGTTCSNGVISKRSTYNRQLKGRVARPRVVPGKDFTPDE